MSRRGRQEGHNHLPSFPPTQSSFQCAYVICFRLHKSVRQSSLRIDEPSKMAHAWWLLAVRGCLATRLRAGSARLPDCPAPAWLAGCAFLS